MRRAGIDDWHASHATGHGREVKGGVHLRRRRFDRAIIETTGSLKLFGVPRDATATGARITSRPGHVCQREGTQVCTSERCCIFVSRKCTSYVRVCNCGLPLPLLKDIKVAESELTVLRQGCCLSSLWGRKRPAYPLVHSWDC